MLTLGGLRKQYAFVSKLTPTAHRSGDLDADSPIDFEIILTAPRRSAERIPSCRNAGPPIDLIGRPSQASHHPLSPYSPIGFRGLTMQITGLNIFLFSSPYGANSSNSLTSDTPEQAVASKVRALADEANVKSAHSAALSMERYRIAIEGETVAPENRLSLRRPPADPRFLPSREDARRG